MKSGTGIQKSASRIAKHPVRIGWFGILEDFYLLSYPLEIARNQKMANYSAHLRDSEK